MVNPLAAITTFFLPRTHHRLSIDEAYRGRILLLSCLIAGVSVSFFWILRLYTEGLHGIALLTLQFVTAVLIVSPFVYKYSGSVIVAGVFLNLPCSLALTVFTYYDGGFYSSALAWFPVLPVFAVFFSGKRYGLIIAGVLLANLCVLLALHRLNLVPVIIVEHQQMNTLLFVSIITVFVLMLVLALLYVEWQRIIHAELQAANQAKNEFLSGVSHELRTPLNSILGFAEVLSKEYAGKLTENQATYVSHIESSGSHLLSLISDLLDISKLDSGVLTLQNDEVNIRTLVGEINDLLHQRALEKNLALRYQIDSELNDRSFMFDERFIKQVLINLLSNAIKFTPENGEIDLTAYIRKQNLVITVSDSGPGIPEDSQEKVFDRFYQINSDSHNKDPGVGLGLAISRDLIELHGGALFIKKSPSGTHDSSSFFVCKIPLSVSKQKTRNKKTSREAAHNNNVPLSIEG